MRTKVTLVLLFLNVVLFFFIFYVRPHFLVPAEGKDRPGRILGAQAANIQKLEIKTESSGSTVQLERRGTAWFLTQPIEWPANEFAVKPILNELQFLEQVTSFAVKDLAKNGQSLADYGLDRPPMILTFTGAPNAPDAPPPKPVVLKIGSPANLGNLLYVLSPEGDRIYVVKRSLAESLAVKLDQLRADTLFTIPVFEARALSIQFGPPSEAKIRIRREDPLWSFEVPLRALANKSETETVLSELASLRIKNFMDARAAEPARTGLDPAKIRISIEGNNRVETLLVGAPLEAPAADPALSPKVEYYYGRLSNANVPLEQSPIVTFAMPTKLLNTLLNAQEKLRERRILNFDPATIVAIKISAPGQPELSLQRLENAPSSNEAAWQIVHRTADGGPKPMPADRAIVQKLLERLAALKAEKFTKDDPDPETLENFGFNRPALQVQLDLQQTAPAAAGPTAATSLTLQVVGSPESSRTAYAQYEHRVYEVSSEILHDTPVTALAYRDRLVRELPAGAQITALKLTDLSDNTAILDTPLPLPASTPENGLTAIRRAAIESLIAQLRMLRAKRFEAENFPDKVRVAGEDRPWKYRLDATLSLVGGAGTQTVTSTLYFSERAGGTTQWVGSKDAELVFEAEQPLLDALFALTYGTRDPGVTPPSPNGPASKPAPTPTPAPSSEAPSPAVPSASPAGSAPSTAPAPVPAPGAPAASAPDSSPPTASPAK